MGLLLRPTRQKHKILFEKYLKAKKKKSLHWKPILLGACTEMDGHSVQT
jgi:hypothetical protein